MSALEWEPLADEDLERELRGAAFGRREAGERSTCGRYLVAMFNGSHPLHAGREELYGRAGESWAVKSSHGTREAACREAERQAGLDLDRASTRCPCAATAATDGAHAECARCRTYRCARCERWRPWSDGAADDMATLCDACWGAVEGVAEEPAKAGAA